MDHYFNGNFGGDYVEGNKISNRPDSPSPDHPNAIECPQCWKITWKGTQNCVHCSYDVWRHNFSVKKKCIPKAKSNFRNNYVYYFLIGLVFNNIIDNPPMWLVFLPFRTFLAS